MSKEIVIRFKWSKELAIKASKHYYDWDMKNSAKRYIGWFFIALTQFAIVGALKHNAFGLLYISTFFVLYWYYGRWYLRKKMIERFYNSSNIKDKDVEFILKDGELFFENEKIDILKVLKFDDGVMLQTSINPLFFAKDSFKNFDDFQTFLEVMRDKGKL